MDGPEAGTVAGSHVLVESLNGLSAGHLAVLLVHVVGTGARVVAEPDTEVLDLERVLLVDLLGKIRCQPAIRHPRCRTSSFIVAASSSSPFTTARRLFQVLRSRVQRVSTYHVQADDLTSGLLDLLQATHEVPVTGLGNDGVGGKDAHAVQGRGGVGLCRQVPANNLVLLETTCCANSC